MVKMIATEKCPRRHGLPGQEIDVTRNCVRFFRESGWAVPVDEAAEADAANARAALEDEYERATGGRPNPRWKDETLRTKIEEARSGGTYRRRDMRAED